MSVFNWIKSRSGKDKEDFYQAKVSDGIERLQVVEDILRKLQKRERRQGQLLEMMHQEFSTKLDGVYKRIDTGIPYDSIYDFAANFALYFMQQDHTNNTNNTDNTDNTEKSIWSKFVAMLDNLDMELILDLYSPFDDSRHSVCDTRFDAAQPEGIILEVVQPGLIIQNQIKKYAVVVINKRVGESVSRCVSASVGSGQ